MWICPECKRSFKRTNQVHYCSNIPIDTESYIASQPEYARETAHLLVDTLRREVPGVCESIKWSMPSFSDGKTSIQFSANKVSLSFYVGAEVLSAFDLGNLKSKKDALYIPYDQPFPTELVTKIVRFLFVKEE